MVTELNALKQAVAALTTKTDSLQTDVTNIKTDVGTIETTVEQIAGQGGGITSCIRRIQRGNYNDDTPPSINLTGFTNINKMIYIIHGTRASGSDDIPYNVSDVTLTVNKLSMSPISGYGGRWRFAYQVIEFY